MDFHPASPFLPMEHWAMGIQLLIMGPPAAPPERSPASEGEEQVAMVSAFLVTLLRVQQQVNALACHLGAVRATGPVARLPLLCRLYTRARVILTPSKGFGGSPLPIQTSACLGVAGLASPGSPLPSQTCLLPNQISSSSLKLSFLL